MTDFEDKNEVISKIRKYHPDQRPARFRHFRYYTGAIEQGGIRSTEWNYEEMIKSEFSDLKLCLELLEKNVAHRSTLRVNREAKLSQEAKFLSAWFSKMTDDMIYNKLAGLAEKFTCKLCHLEQTLHDKKQPMQEDSKCSYCGTELIEQ